MIRDANTLMRNVPDVAGPGEAELLIETCYELRCKAYGTAIIIGMASIKQGVSVMTPRTISLLALCAALTACNSKAPEPADTTAADPASEVGTAAAPAATAVPPSTMKAAPEGLPSRIAREVITAGGKPCAGVAKADRQTDDGTILASCTSGENYRIYTTEAGDAVAVAQ